MNCNTLPEICKTCIHNDHGMCFSGTWCSRHPGVMPEHKATDLYHAIVVQDELQLEDES